jgi:DNA-binding CsgD family transcriptional regulator
MDVVKTLEKSWLQRLNTEQVHWSSQQKNSIIKWLLGKISHDWEGYTSDELEVVEKGLEYRYRILIQRYLGQSETKAYQNLMARLASITVLRNKIKQWIALSRDRQQQVVDVLEEIIHQMLQNDRYLQEQIQWIGECTSVKSLRNSLLLTSIEEYCLRPIRNQPLLMYRFVNFLRDSQKGGMTKVPSQQAIRLVSEQINESQSETLINLLDSQAIADYEAQQRWDHHEVLRLQVQREFETYLRQNLDDLCVQWFLLYLKGFNQEAIAEKLNLPIKKIYRLREKVSYHAIKNFSLKQKPELVANWLEISLKEHNFGLTLSQWEKYQAQLNCTQRQLLVQLKSGNSPAEIAQTFDWKESKVIQEWGNLYQMAQSLRNS